MTAIKTTRSRDPLRAIPGIGPSLANDLRKLGVVRVEDLKQRDPQAMYDELCHQTGTQQDRCVLYAFRCAVYFASRSTHDPKLLKWWNWKS
jgi:Pathogenicity locus